VGHGLLPVPLLNLTLVGEGPVDHLSASERKVNGKAFSDPFSGPC